MTSPRLFRASAAALVLVFASLVVIYLRRSASLDEVVPLHAPKEGQLSGSPQPVSQENTDKVEIPVTAAVAPAAQAESLAPPPPIEPALAMRQDLRWRAAMPEREFAAFREWTGRFEKASAEQRTALLAEGRKLVEQRRQEMSELIDKDPQRALELAIPVSVRRTLPVEITKGIEEPVRGRGDLWVAAALPLPGQELRVRTTQRTVQLKDGRVFDAYTFGRRASSPTRMNIAIHGVALDGKLALDELPGRILEPVEAAEVKTGGELCPESGIPTDVLGEELAVDFGGANPLFYCGPAHAYAALLDAADAEGALPPAIAAADGDGGAGNPPIAQSPFTEGTKKMLIIRVDFPDFTGQVVGDGTLTTLISNMKTHWEDMSYGKASWTLVGSGSAITPTLRLPNGQASYTDFGTRAVCHIGFTSPLPPAGTAMVVPKNPPIPTTTPSP